MKSKKKILNAVAEVVAERGFSGVRIDILVKKSGVSKDVFYHYFKTKEEVFFEVAHSGIQKYLQDIEHKTFNGESSAPIENVVNAHFNHLSNNKSTIKFLSKFKDEYDGTSRVFSMVSKLVEHLTILIDSALWVDLPEMATTEAQKKRSMAAFSLLYGVSRVYWGGRLTKCEAKKVLLFGLKSFARR